MLKINYQCDYCGKLEKGYTDENPPPGKGWFTLGYKMPNTELSQGDWIVTHHFCSSQCMDNAVSVKKGEAK